MQGLWLQVGLGRGLSVGAHCCVAWAAWVQQQCITSHHVCLPPAGFAPNPPHHCSAGRQREQHSKVMRWPPCSPALPCPAPARYTHTQRTQRCELPTSSTSTSLAGRVVPTSTARSSGLYTCTHQGHGHATPRHTTPQSMPSA